MSVLLKDLGNGIKSIIINDPKTYNSLSFKTLGSLIKIFKKLNNDNKTHVIVISGNGKGFSAGHNLKEIKNLKIRNKYQKLFSKNEQVEILVNAEVTVNPVDYHNATPLVTLVSQSMYTCSME